MAQANRTSCQEFSIATILSLFLDSQKADGNTNANLKAVVVDHKPVRLLQAGYVSKIQFVCDIKMYFAGQCQPEMMLAATYRVRFVMDSIPAVRNSLARVEIFLFSQCSYPAGKRPLATCKHIATVLYALEDFSRLGYANGAVSGIEKLQA